MTEVLLCIPLPAISINRWSGASKRFLSKEAKSWTQDVQHALSGPQNQNQLELMHSSFSPKKHSFGIAFNFVSPKAEFYNKQGLFSSKTCDLTNVEKPIVDLLFLERHQTSEYSNIGWDDKYISELHSKKTAGQNWEIQVRVWIIDRK